MSNDKMASQTSSCSYNMCWPRRMDLEAGTIVPSEAPAHLNEEGGLTDFR